jgi:transposase
MSDLFWLSRAQLRRIERYFPRSRGVPRVDDLKVISGIMFVIRNGLRWRDAPQAYGPHKTLYNRFVRWSRLGVFNEIFASLAADKVTPDTLMIDTTHLKAHRTAASLLKKGAFPAISAAPKVGLNSKLHAVVDGDGRPLRTHLLLSNLHRSYLHLLSQSMSPEPSLIWSVLP